MSEKTFPANWLIGQDYDPNTHMTKLSRKDRKTQQWVENDYLNVQNRLLWFIRDQRNLIALGLAKVPYTIQTDLVEIDRERGWAHYKTFIRDVLGNEATMYGSQAAASFPDYTEKASTKSLGRALLLLGYGTASAPELDEGEVVDSPTDPPPMSYRQVMREGREAAQATQAAAPAQTSTKTAATAPRSLGKWLNDKGYISIEAKEKVIAEAGVTVIPIGQGHYSDADKMTVVYYVEGKEAKEAAKKKTA